MGQEIQFKQISRDDFERLERLFPDSKDMWIKYRAERMEQFADHTIDVFVIEIEGVFIGEITVNYISRDLPGEAIPGRRAYLQAYRLDKDYQGKGLGQRLLSYVLHTLTERGYSEFTIGVEEDNEIAKHIYFKYGFVTPIDYGHGDEFDPSEYTLYLKKQ